MMKEFASSPSQNILVMYKLNQTVRILPPLGIISGKGKHFAMNSKMMERMAPSHNSALKARAIAPIS